MGIVLRFLSLGLPRDLILGLNSPELLREDFRDCFAFAEMEVFGRFFDFLVLVAFVGERGMDCALVDFARFLVPAVFLSLAVAGDFWRHVFSFSGEDTELPDLLFLD